MSSARDKNVLNLIMNPFMPTFSEADSEDSKSSEDSTSKLPNFLECERLEVDGVKFAETKNFTEALEKFSEAIRLCPNNPSPYNNRAQAYRLLENIDAAIADLNQAIELCTNEKRQNENRIIRVASQAYVQRALIHQLQGETDLAKANYEKASEKGSTFAKTQLIALNPYAAMCNKMLTEVMSKVQSGKSEQ